MKIAVVGCGAMGTIFAGLLASTGNEVIALVRTQSDADHINKNGIRVEGASGDHKAAIRAFCTPPEETVDLVIIAAKATQIEAASSAAKGLVGSNTLVLTIQNGLGSADVVASILGGDNLLVGIAGGFGAQLVGPGHTYHNNMQIVRMGAYSTLEFDKVKAVADLWAAAGFKAEPATSILVMQWEKLICNVAYSAPCAITGMTVGQVMDDPDVGPVSRAAATEAWNVARKLGVQITVADPVAHVRAFASGMPNSRPSLLQDVEAGKPCEIDFINGAIPREATKVGVAAPVNTMLAALVKAKERRTMSAKLGN